MLDSLACVSELETPLVHGYDSFHGLGRNLIVSYAEISLDPFIHILVLEVTDIGPWSGPANIPGFSDFHFEVSS